MKYQDVVLVGKTSPSVAPREPAPRSVTYEVVIALACHVIGPVEPTVWKLIASFLPAMAVLSSAALCPSPFDVPQFHRVTPHAFSGLQSKPRRTTVEGNGLVRSRHYFRTGLLYTAKAPSSVIGWLRKQVRKVNADEP